MKICNLIFVIAIACFFIQFIQNSLNLGFLRNLDCSIVYGYDVFGKPRAIKFEINFFHLLIGLAITVGIVALLGQNVVGFSDESLVILKRLVFMFIEYSICSTLILSVLTQIAYLNLLTGVFAVAYPILMVYERYIQTEVNSE